MAPPASISLSSSSKKRLWSSDEDNTLIEFVGNLEPRNWKMIAQNSGLSRDGNSCRCRWKNYLDPTINRGDFTQEEDDIIIKAQGSCGNKWSKMVKKLPGRTDNQIKNYWNGHLSKKEQVSKEEVISNHSEFHEVIHPRSFTNHEIQDFLTMPFPNLESLDFPYEPFSNHDIQDFLIMPFPNLEYLDFPHEPFSNHDIQDFLHELPSLEDQGFPLEVHQDVLPEPFPNLESLDFPHDPFSNHDIEDFLHELPNLEDQDFLLEVHQDVLREPSPNLESLDFPHDPFSNHEIEDILHELPNLEDQDFPLEVHQNVLPERSPNLEFNQANLQEPSSDIECQQDLLYELYPDLRPLSSLPAYHW